MESPSDKFNQNDIVYIKANDDIRGLQPDEKGENNNNPIAIFSVLNPDVDSSRRNTVERLVAIKLIGVLKGDNGYINFLSNFINVVIEVPNSLLKEVIHCFWESLQKSKLDEFYNLEKTSEKQENTFQKEC